MAATDHPLKRLVSLFTNDFAAWLLNCPVHGTQPLNVELAADILATDAPGPRRRGAPASLDGPVGPFTARGDGNHGRKTA